MSDYFTRSLEGLSTDRPVASDVNNGFIYYAVDTDETTRSNGQTWINVTPHLLGAQIVGTSQAVIPHGLPYTPSLVLITMTSGGTIYKSAPSDGVNVYLTADSAGLTCEVAVR